MTASRLTHRGEWAQKIDYSEAEQMLRAGATQKDVAEHFGASQSAVSQAITRGMIKVQTNRTDDRAMPWKPIMPEHRHTYLARMLRVAHRRARGMKSAAVMEAQLDTMLKTMTRDGWVVDYDPEQGFIKVPRRLGVDEGLIREPGLDDRGRARRTARPRKTA